MVEEEFKMCSQLYAVLILAFVNYSLVNGDEIKAPTGCGRLLTTTSYDYTVTYPIEEIKNRNEIYLTVFIIGARDAHIIFAPGDQPAKQYDKAYEIVLGSEGNTNACIRSTRLGQNEIRVSEPHILFDKSWSAYWIRIKHGLIEVGYGLKDYPFMTWKDDTPMSINHYGFASWKDGNTVNWAFPCTKSTSTPPKQCGRVTVTTSYDYTTKYSTGEIKNRKGIFFVFMVKAARDVHIIFAPNNQTAKQYDRAYEIVIGSVENTMSVIRSTRRGHDEVRVTEQNIVSDKEWRQFWIRINSQGLIEVGKGTEKTPFMSWKDDSRMEINHYGLASWTNKNVVNWAFPCAEIKPDPSRCTLIVADSFDYRVAYPITDKERDGKDIFLKISIKANNNALVVLSPTSKPVKQNGRAYEILIGGDADSNYDCTSIRLERQSAHPVDRYKICGTSKLNPNEWRLFWIRMSPDGVFQIGNKLGSDPFLVWKHEKPMKIISFGLASFKNSQVQYAYDCVQ